jgi:hypothetical protein
MRKHISSSASKSLSVMAGVVNRAGAWKVSKSITFSREANLAMMLPKI